MMTSPLLSNIRHRTMITPVSPLLTRLIHISPSCWTIYRPFEIIREMVTVHWIGLQIQCTIQIHCFKRHSVRYELCFKKYLVARAARTLMDEPEQSASEVERTPTAIDSLLFYSGHKQHERERPDMEQKYMKSDKVQRQRRVNREVGP